MSLRKMSSETLLFSALLLIFAPLLPAGAQDVDVPRNLTMRNSTDPTVGNILKEGVPFIHNFGFNNTFIGSAAGNFTMTHPFGSNTATGFQALHSNTNGFNNTASGRTALLSNTIGFNNTASGVAALQSNTTGEGNTASGVNALFNNTTGDFNTANGDDALESNTAGDRNTAIGAAALSGNTIGEFNTATGLGALFFNTTGNFNTASGAFALQSNTTGNNNTAFGSNADVSAGNLINATAIGFGAIVNASNKIRLGNEAVTVIEGLVGFTANSDRNRQENFQPVRGEEVLRKIRRLILTSWNYVGQEPMRFRHYGPGAQDFFDAFGNDGVGTIGTPTTITSSDIEGILMVAVQALERRTEDEDEQIDALKARLEALERMVGEVAGR
jgi:endosialidase-like protein